MEVLVFSLLSRAMAERNSLAAESDAIRRNSEEARRSRQASIVNGLLNVGDAVNVPQGRGTIQFSGPTSFAQGEWIGVALDDANGKNDGSVKGVKYFDCQPKHGIFCRRSTCVKADGSSNLHSSVNNDSDAAQQLTPRKKVKRKSSKEESSQAPQESLLYGSNGNDHDGSGSSSSSPNRRNPKVSHRKQAASNVGSRWGEQPSELSEVATSAQLQLAEAMEEQDIEKLRVILPFAASVGVTHEDLEAARQVLHFKANHVYLHEVQNIESVVNNLSRVAQAQTGLSPTNGALKPQPFAADSKAEERVMEEMRLFLCTQLQTTCDDMRSCFSGLVRELRQDLSAIRRDLNKALTGDNRMVASQPSEIYDSGKLDDSESSSPRPTLPPTESTSKDTSAKARGFVDTEAAGGLQRTPQERSLARRRESATITLQRRLRELKERQKGSTGNARCFQVMVDKVRDRHDILTYIWERHRGDDDGLDKDNFSDAMGEAHRRIAERQCNALFDGFCKGTGKTQLDLRAFASICDAVGSGDRAASEFAGMNVDDFQRLAQSSGTYKFNVKYKKSTSKGLSSEALRA